MTSDDFKPTQRKPMSPRKSQKINKPPADIVDRLESLNEGNRWPMMSEAAAELRRLRSALSEETEIARQTDDALTTAQAALERLEQWSEAYPLDIFPEPDLKKARALLEAGGMTLDAISAHAMRHVVEGVGEIAREALEGNKP